MEQFKTPLSITSQFSFCGLPFRLDSYAGCSFNCTYCFARLRGGFKHSRKLRPASPDKIITKFKNAMRMPDIATGLISELIRNRTPVHFGGMSDPFQPIERDLGISLKILKYLCEINYPMVISTRSTLLSSPKYLEVIKDSQSVVIQFSFSTTKDEKSEIVEPYANKPSQIMRSIETLSNHGINTTVRWQPYIPGFSETPSDFITSISNLGVKHLGFEHLKLPMERSNPLWNRLKNNLNYDISRFYMDQGCQYDGRELILNAAVKLPTILQVKKELERHSITFGAADNELQYLSETNCCCSGVDQFGGFNNWNKFQISHAIKKSEGNEISFSLIENEWRPVGSIDQFLNSKSRISKQDNHNTIENYVLRRWEDLSSSFNPTRSYGVEYNGKKDSNGLKIYEWNEKLKNSVIKTKK